MKVLNMISNASNGIKKVGVVLSMSLFSVMAFAADPAATPDDTSISNLGAFQNVVAGNAGIIYKTAIIIATLAGLILIIKGLVHLKQNYTGTGQEKHLSKGIASVAFGTCLMVAVPLSHTLVGSMSTQTTFDTNDGNSVVFSS